ncbi:hypothetical protein BD779DRAFT_1671161 [Infundibulicybe gibba]|nr:hypothetical protein BD779DRAFT_1671161 [Infundibulicybe gibba]
MSRRDAIHTLPPLRNFYTLTPAFVRPSSSDQGIIDIGFLQAAQTLRIPFSPPGGCQTATNIAYQQLAGCGSSSALCLLVQAVETNRGPYFELLYHGKAFEARPRFLAVVDVIIHALIETIGDNTGRVGAVRIPTERGSFTIIPLRPIPP